MRFDDEINYEDENPSTLGLRTRENRRALALFLRKIGENHVGQLLLQAGLPDVSQHPLQVIRGMAKSGELPGPLAKQILDLPWGCLETDIQMVGVVSDAQQTVLKFEDHPLLQTRTGRRGQIAKRMKEIKQENLKYAVITSPGLVPLLGDFSGSMDTHLKTMRAVISRLRKQGCEVVIRSTESVVTSASVNIHSNLLFHSDKSDEKLLDEIEGVSNTECEVKAVYDISGIVDYVFKRPIKLEEEFLKAVRDGLCTDGDKSLFDIKVEHTEAVLLWLYTGLKGRRLLADYSDKNGKNTTGPARLNITSGGNDTTRPAHLNITSGGNNQEVKAGKTRVNSRRTGRKALENVILKMGKSRLFISKVVEPVIFIKNYTKTPKTEDGKKNLDKIREIQAHYRNGLEADEVMSVPESVKSIEKTEIEKNVDRIISDFVSNRGRSPIVLPKSLAFYRKSHETFGGCVLSLYPDEIDEEIARLRNDGDVSEPDEIPCSPSGAIISPIRFDELMAFVGGIQ